MSKLRLGTYLLPSGEVVLIRTLMRLFSQDPTFSWVFAEEGPYDALIMDSTPSAAAEAGNAPAARVVLKFASGRDDASQTTLQRPLKAEKLQEWLKATGLELLAAQASAPATVSVSARAPAPPPAAAPALDSRLQALKEIRFKLLSLPPKEVLQNDPALIRMSTLLTRRPMRPAELAELSHQPLDLSLLFIQKLLALKLIAPEGQAPAAAAQETAPPRPKPAPEPKPKPELEPEPEPEQEPDPEAERKSSLTSKPKELFNGIRKRFGI